MKEYDVAIVGGGAAGMSAARGALSAGAKHVLLIERDDTLGGILNQCAHRGFGLQYFGEELTGMAYAERCRELIAAEKMETLIGTTVLAITKDRELLLSGRACGLARIAAKAVVLASGCREKPIGALPVTGTRPSGIFTAGMAQRMITLGGYDIGHRVVVLGSGDVGMIVARELAKRGREVVMVVEQRDRCGGLERNRIACLDAHNIPLALRSTVTQIHGTERIYGVTVQNIASREERFIRCDTLIVSVGLIPERELLEGAMAETGKVPSALFVCGNACFVHDVVDDVSAESERTGALAAGFAATEAAAPDAATSKRGNRRATGTRICIACPKECVIYGSSDGYTGMACGRPNPALAEI